MNKLIKDILTEDDNQTFCIARFVAIVAVLTFSACALVHVFHGSSFDFSQLGIGFGSVLSGSGVAIGAKAATQKDK
jgi:hypothetical protein